MIAARQVLCVIEALKTMNEIQAEVGGRVTDILVESGQPVEYNQVFFDWRASSSRFSLR